MKVLSSKLTRQIAKEEWFLAAQRAVESGRADLAEKHRPEGNATAREYQKAAQALKLELEAIWRKK